MAIVDGSIGAWATIGGNTTIDNIAGWYSTDTTITCDPPIKTPYAETIKIKVLPEKTKLLEGVELMTLYDVYMVYAEDRDKPIVLMASDIIASNEENAKIKSGLMKDVEEGWDADYLTFIVKCIGEVKVKAKPKEVKTV